MVMGVGYREEGIASEIFLFCGLQVIKKASQKTIAKRSRLKAFTKVVNYNHIMPTRYWF
jgi:hypothetical protein